MKVEYDSNNSGGDWWLKDGDWKKLKKRGWKIDWYKNDKKHKGARWLGALASKASKKFAHEDFQKAIDEFSEITGINPSDCGCSCCGPPHSFDATYKDGKQASWDVEYTGVGSISNR